MDVKKTASQIVNLIGGKENVNHLEHCSTRLRFTLKDNNLADIKGLEKVDGVIGVRQNVQCQVIIGNDVVEVYNEVKKELGNLQESNKSSSNNKVKLSWGSVFLDYIISIFQPLIPAIAGGGILKSLLLLASVLGLMDDKSQTFQILNLIGTAPLYFLPILVAITTANKLKVNAIVAVSAVGTFLLPDLTKMLEAGTNFLGIGLENIAYASQVFPAILTVFLYAVLERFFTRYSPKSIRIFFVPLMSLLITVPLALIFIGPLGYNVGTLITTAIVFLYKYLGWVATALLAGVLPFMVVTGMHKAMIPYMVSTMSSLKSEVLYLPASLAHNISESGASFAVAIKTKDSKLRATAISAGVSALFGITEPALYGITILHKRVLYSVMISSLISGAVAGLFALKAFAIVGPGIASITMFIDKDNTMNIVWAILTLVVAFVISFLAVIVLYKDKESEEINEKDIEIKDEAIINEKVNEEMYSPTEGIVVPLSDIKDDVFSSGMVGKGLGVLPSHDVVVAPFDAEVTMLFKTQHAIGLKTDNNAEILLHIGIDTVQLDGKYFKSHVNVGDKVKKGEPLITCDFDKVEESGYDTTIIFIVTNQEEFEIETHNKNKKVTVNDNVMTIHKK